jgi:Trypsin/SdrD B-like domain
MKRLLSSLLFLMLIFSSCQNPATGVVQGIVFLDANNNGIQDDTETGTNGVLVQLLIAAQNPRVFTSETGLFRFSGVPVGIEELLVTSPVGMRISTANARTRVNVFKDTATNIAVGIGKSLNVGAVTGTVFKDDNANGTRDVDELGISGAIVDLTTSIGSVVTLRTDNDGFYQTDSVESGDVSVRLRESCGVKTNAGNTRVSRVFVGSVSAIQAFGVAPVKGRVNGLIFRDANDNGLKDSGEMGLPGWTVYADLNDNTQYDLGEPASATCTNGNYALEGVPDGNIKIRHVMNLGYSSSQAVNVMAATTVNPFIVGGQPASEAAYPFMVSLVRASASNPYDGAFCGGSLIAPNWVLTAAHCARNISASSTDVVLGTNRLESPVTRIRVAQIIVHPEYDGITQDFDIALIRLSSSVNVQPVQLLTPSQRSLSNVGIPAIVIGWGDQAWKASNYPIDLHEAVVPIYDQAKCDVAYRNPDGTGGITQRMICAGYPQGGIDSCQGDSGGPLLISSAIPGLWLQAGIVSFGNDCALPNFPGVYTRVSEFNTFLEAQLGRGLAGKQEVLLETDQTLDGISFAVR